jgi:membrane-associated HD superfamily phosphohydrolase
VLIAIITMAISVVIVENSAAPKKYRLELGESSKYDISAPRDIENAVLTEKFAKEAAENIVPVMERLDSVSIDSINSVNEFFNDIRSARQSVSNSLSDQGTDPDSQSYLDFLAQERQRLRMSCHKDEEHGIELLRIWWFI